MAAHLEKKAAARRAANAKERERRLRHKQEKIDARRRLEYVTTERPVEDGDDRPRKSARLTSSSSHTSNEGT